VSLRGSFYRGHGCDIDVPHDTEIKPWTCENADCESVYNESHLYTILQTMFRNILVPLISISEEVTSQGVIAPTLLFPCSSYLQQAFVSG
jgi:hypothetical protein